MKYLITLLLFVSINSFGQVKNQSKEKLDSVKLNQFDVQAFQDLQKKIDSVAKPFIDQQRVIIKTRLSDKADPKKTQFLIRGYYIVFPVEPAVPSYTVGGSN